jgi:hypothetical protein
MDNAPISLPANYIEATNRKQMNRFHVVVIIIQLKIGRCW